MTYREAYELAAASFEDIGIESPGVDAFRLFEAATDIHMAGYLVIKNQEMPESEFNAFAGMIRRRLNREPCQYIIGSCEFMGLPFKVTSAVLIPRQDTEVLAEAAVGAALAVIAAKGEMISDDKPHSARGPGACGENTSGAEIRILDLCTGSGAIAVSLAKMLSLAEPAADVLISAVDISADALKVAEENARINGVNISFLESDLFDLKKSSVCLEDAGTSEGDREKNARSLLGSFDVIVCNPPYVSEGEYEELAPEIREFEPQEALLAGSDGLSFYRRIAKEAPMHLGSDEAPSGGGILLLEIGSAQAADVSRLLSDAGFVNIECIKDLSGLDRVIKCAFRPH